ncbi:gamma-glutamyltransferase [Aerophototrophica crusticola]|uniref:Glutathione hydrolase proenzyme n=1 Tax=Aerophototrophica crusticola TaxID=1709002 RepID=A0A858R974_9PROT|nr:gamma-glutamyltransferase [Rhodospirillaceae bacterium B3]
MRKTLGALLVAAVAAMPLMTETVAAADTNPQPGRGDRLVGANFAGRSEVIAKNGMAATSQPLATQVAVTILQQGGSAADAAIAANAMLGLVEPTGSGVGGDLFALVWDPKTNKLYGLNASGRAPKGQTLEQLRQRLADRDAIPSFGSLSVTVPGAVGGWFDLHKKFGKLPMDKVLAPAIAYAQDGFPLSPFIGQGMARNIKRLLEQKDVEEVENLKKTYLPDGRMPEAGRVFRNPDLARTYSLIAKGGRDAFYKGEVAKTVDAYMKRIGGPLRFEDFADHTSTWVEPVSTNYRGYDVWQIPPNGQGIATLQMLNLLEGYDLKAMGHNSADFVHVMVEAKKLAFADRSRWYADPEFVKVPLQRLISKDYANERRPLIDMAKAGTPDPGKMPESHDTIFLSTADKDGMMVALIQSNYRGMGSGLVPDGLGFMLQDRGEQFALNPQHPNVYAPGKRPFHTIIPGFVTKDGKPWLAYGVMGGAMQPQGHVQVLVNMIDFGMNVQEAGDAARWQHDGSAEPTGAPAEGVGTLFLEQGIAPSVLEELKRRGHNAIYKPGTHYGSYEAIQRDHANGVYRGGTEMRVDGHAAGF